MRHLSARERVLVGLALPLVLIAAGWTFVWVPAEAARVEARTEIAAWRQLRAAAAAVDLTPPPTEAPRRGPMPPRVTGSAAAFDISPSRLEPEGERLRVIVDEAPFDDLILWVAAMEAEHGLRLTGAEVERRAVPGTVSARLTLEDMQ